MNNPSPLVPQGSLQQNANGRSYVKMAFFTVVAIHIVFFGGLLFQGCKKPAENTDTAAANPAGLDQTNLNVAPMTGTDTNLVPTITPGTVAAGGAGLASSNYSVQPLPPAVTTPVEPAPVAPSTHDYIVIKGDIVEHIAKKNGVSQKALLDANPGLVPTKLKIGQKIQIPGAAGSSPSPVAGADVGTAPVAADSSTYVVKSGDTLTKIVKTHGTSLKAVRSLNGLKTDQIKVGQKLKLPMAKTAPAPVAPEAQPPVTTAVTPTPAPTTSAPVIAQPLQPGRSSPSGR